MVGALLARADVLLIGGAMAVPFLAAQGYPVGSSVLDDSTVAVARGLLEQARHDGAEIVLPSDFVAAAARAADSPARVVPAAAIPSGLMALDIGPESARQFASRLAVARTVFWNGPMGVFELAPFAEGTRVVAQGLIDSGAFSVVGGGDTTAAVRALGFAAGSFGYLSTGGGASLEYLEGRELPGLMALQEAAPALASRPPA